MKIPIKPDILSTCVVLQNYSQIIVWRVTCQFSLERVLPAEGL